MEIVHREQGKSETFKGSGEHAEPQTLHHGETLTSVLYIGEPSSPPHKYGNTKRPPPSPPRLRDGIPT